MQENAKKRREEGYAYTVDGENKTLMFEQAIEKFNEIAEKYKNNENLTEEDILLVKYNLYAATDINPADIYDNFFTDKKYIEPAGDMLDWLLNACLCGKIWDDTKEGYAIDEANGQTVYIYEVDEKYTEKYNELHGIFNRAGLTEKMPDKPGQSKPLIDVPLSFGWEVIDLKTIRLILTPMLFRRMLIRVFKDSGDKDENGNILYENPFSSYGNSLTYEQIIVKH